MDKMEFRKNFEKGSKTKEIIGFTENGKFAQVKLTTKNTETGKNVSDVLEKVPTDYQGLLEKEGSEENVYQLAIRMYFTDQLNSLRTDGVCSENKERAKKEKMANDGYVKKSVYQNSTDEELLANLSEEMKKKLGLV